METALEAEMFSVNWKQRKTRNQLLLTEAHGFSMIAIIALNASPQQQQQHQQLGCTGSRLNTRLG